ncbi:porin [Caballeronia sp. INDeC2]|uniref:porin n=1 Tax=Caballeronia sp. INDeC2 TaxID=2921747 RepID=UPI002028E765|nr:porin [Caballeronia sp. INDeC2]
MSKINLGREIMKLKNILPAAVLLSVWPAAHAQTVTLYGVADASVDYIHITGTPTAQSANVTRLSSEGSYFGLRGIEPLGGGLSAVFQIEGNYSINSGSFSGFNRDTYVGLQNDRWGLLTLGQNTTPMRDLGLVFDLTPGGNTGIGAIQSLLTINGRSTGADSRRPSSVRYRSPSVYGFRADLLYGFGQNTSGPTDNMFGAGLRYQAGPFLLGYAYDSRNNANPTGLAQANSRDVRHRIGVQYQVLPDWMVGAFYDLAKNSGNFGTGNGKITEHSFGVITRWSSVAHSVYAMFVQSQPVECNGVTTNNGVNCATAGSTRARLFTLGYTYALSKSTLIRMVASRISNGAAARYDFSNGALGVTAGEDLTGVSIGLRHRF